MSGARRRRWKSYHYLAALLAGFVCCHAPSMGRSDVEPSTDAALLQLEVPEHVSVSCGALLNPANIGMASVSGGCSPLVIDAGHSVWINEFHYDNLGLDKEEFVEVAGVAGTDLACWRLVLYNGESGQPYDTVYLSGVIPDEGCGFGAVNFMTPGLQNGAVAGYSQGDGIALVRDPWDRVAQLISYEGTFTATGGAAAGWSSSDIGVAQSDTIPAGHSLQCSGAFGSFTWASPSARSPGRLNDGQSLDPCSGVMVLSWSDGFAPAICARDATVTRTWAARDSAGQSTSRVQTISIADRDPPYFTSFPENAVVECDGSADPEFTGGWPVATDGCTWQFALSGAWINEIHYDDDSSDPNSDFVEVAGVAGVDLTGYALVYYDGSGRRYGGVQYLSGTIPTDSESGYGAVIFRPRAVTGIGLQNGPADGVALVHLPTEQVIEFLSYEGALTASNGPAAGQTSVGLGVSESPSTPVGASIHRTGVAASWSGLGWSATMSGSPGTFNVGQELPPASVSPRVTFTDSVSDGTDGKSGISTITRTWTAIDLCGNPCSRDQNITLADAVPPSLVPPAEIQVEGCDVSAIPGLAYSELASAITLAQFQALGGEAWDACGIESITYQDATPANQPEIVLRTFTVVDRAGNRATAVQTISINAGTVVISMQPADLSVCAGDDVTFEVGASGSGLAYQWRKDGEPISGATQAVLELTAVTPADAGAYDVVVSGTCGSVVSRAASLLICEPVTITTQPLDQQVCSGTHVRFEVAAMGSGLAYQWRKDGEPISGATQAVLELTAVTPADAGAYDVVVSGTCGSVVSRAASLLICEPVMITTQPLDQQVCSGTHVRFEVAAMGSGLAYQWRKDGEPISGATQAVLELTAVSPADAGAYDVVVSGTCGSVVSRAASLLICEPVMITTQPLDQQVCSGTHVRFEVAAMGSGLVYQWRKDGEPISGATQAVLELTAVSVSDAGAYDVVVSGTCGSVVSRAASLLICEPVMITTQPLDQQVCSGTHVRFEVAAMGSGLVYQWRKDGEPISGATQAVLELTAVSPADAGAYDVVVSGTCGSVVSRAASLLICEPVMITTQPLDQQVCSGTHVRFEVAAMGSGLVYQWRKDGEPISGATQAVLELTAVSPADAGAYDVMVSEKCGSVLSVPATLTVIDSEPVIAACAPDLTLPGEEYGANLPDLRAQIVATDTCTPSALLQIDQSPQPGTVIAAGEHIVIFTIRNPFGATAGCQCRVVVQKASPKPTLSISDTTVTEGDEGASEAVFFVSLSAPSARRILVNFETCPIPGAASALPGVDYVPSSGTLTFEPGEIEKAIPIGSGWRGLAGVPVTDSIDLGRLAGSDGTELRLARSGTGFCAIWTAPAGTYQLQERDNLGPQTVWRTLGVPVVAVGNDRTVLLPNCRSMAFYRLAEAELSKEEGLSRPVRIGVIGDVLCEADEHFAVTLSLPVNAVIERGQGITTIRDDDCSGDPVDVIILPTSLGAETDLIQQYLTEAGLSCRFVEREAFKADALAGCSLLIWDDCGAAEDGLRNEDVELLRQAHTDGIPLLLIGERLAGSSTNLAEPFRSQWTDLTGLRPGNTQSDKGHVSVLLDTGHHVVNGAFGFVEDFACELVESVTLAGIDHTVLARCGESAVILACGEAPGGTRRVVQDLLISSFSTDGASIAERRRLFLNSVWWLMGKPFCGLTDLAISQTVSPTSGMVGVPTTYVLAVHRGGECPATGVIVTHVLPAGVAVESVTAPEGVWTQKDGVITFELGALEPMFLELRVTVVPLVPGSLVSQVKIRGNDRDPSPGNNASSLETFVGEGGRDGTDQGQNEQPTAGAE
ncbi:MAG: Calx-beta domain-containing protein [Verrucomicrobiia bacterium]